MKVLVTGSNGLIGQKLLQKLEARPDTKVYGLSKSSFQGPANSKAVHFTADLTNQSQTGDILKSVRPDVIVHLAAISSPDLCEEFRELCQEVNVGVPAFLSSWCSRTSTHLIHASTDFVFDGIEGPYSEEAPLTPISAYGRSKARAEELVASGQEPWSIFRTVLVYGTNPYLPRLNLPLRVIKALSGGNSYQAFTDQYRTPTLADDLALGIYALIDSQKTGIYNLSGDEMISVFDFAVLTARVFGLDESKILPVTAASHHERAPRPARTGLIIEKARMELGFQPTGNLEGLHILKRQLK